jgi:hypothetical protein
MAVYRAFAEPGAMERWLPPDNMTGQMLRFDFREGGSYRMRLVYADPGQGKSAEEYDEVEVRLTRLGGGTKNRAGGSVREPGSRVLRRHAHDLDLPARR